MSYINGSVPTPVKLLLLTTNNGTGSLSVSDLIDFNTTPILNTSTVTIASNSLTLGPGNYMIDAGLGINNNSNPVTNYAGFNLTVDSVAGNSPGSSIQNNKVGTDASVMALSVEVGATKVVRVEITAVGGTCYVEDDFSWVKVLEL